MDESFDQTQAIYIDNEEEDLTDEIDPDEGRHPVCYILYIDDMHSYV